MDNLFIPHDIDQFKSEVLSKEYAYSRIMISKVEFILTNPLNHTNRLYLRNLNLVNDFIKWSLKEHKPLDWRIHINFLLYMSINDYIPKDESLVIQLLAMSASQWTYFDKTANTNIFLQTKILPLRVIQAKKSTSCLYNREIFLKESNRTKINKFAEYAFFEEGMYESIDKYVTQ